jgi:nitrogen regulatory protein P-II 1
MKEIKAFIRPNKIKEVISSLRREGHCCLTVFEGEGTGDYTDPEKEWPSLKLPFLHSKIFKLEVVCEDSKVEAICDIIRQNGKTGKSGDGLIYVSDVQDTFKIRDTKDDNVK